MRMRCGRSCSGRGKQRSTCEVAVSLRKGCGGVGGCPWRVLSAKGASRASWWVPVKNDTNFSGPSTPVRWRPAPHGPPPGQNPRHPPPSFVQSASWPCPILSNPLTSPVIARVLGPCVPAMTTGTQAVASSLGLFPGKLVGIRWQYHGNYMELVWYVCSFYLWLGPH